MITRLLLLCLLFASSCGRREKVSIFFFFPNSATDLKANGYSYIDTTTVYYKRTGDTLENIMRLDEKKNLFSKYFYIKREPKNFKNVTDDSLQSMVNNITRNADDVIFNHESFKILRFKKNTFLLQYGYGGFNKTLYLISYHNLGINSERKLGLENLEVKRSWYEGSTDDRAKIDSAINYVKHFKG